jgi:hypothetical protein
MPLVTLPPCTGHARVIRCSAVGRRDPRRQSLHPIRGSLPPVQARSALASCISGPSRCSHMFGLSTCRRPDAAFCLPGSGHFITSMITEIANRLGRPLPGHDLYLLEQQTFRGAPGPAYLSEWRFRKEYVLEKMEQPAGRRSGRLCLSLATSLARQWRSTDESEWRSFRSSSPHRSTGRDSIQTGTPRDQYSMDQGNNRSSRMIAVPELRWHAPSCWTW